jgi:hypothetical protein
LIASTGAIESLSYRSTELNSLGGPSGEVVIAARDGSAIAFSVAIEATIEMWKDILSGLDPWTG